ncbi:MAG: sn-glycerol-3-phosphate ABC transporter ATP-binding protein UgpC [Actinomycetota bacterium]
MAEVILDHANKTYPNGFEAIEDLSISIADGEFLVLVGPSGCGKSTALRMIAGLEEITGGEIRIGGRVVNDVAPKDRDIAMVFQNYALYPHMTVSDNIGFSLKLTKTPKAEISERVQRAAKILELEPLLERKPGQLSGGQRQRVAMGRAIVRNPQAFLMDEPLSNLDAKLRVQMRAEISRIQRDLGVTTVYVTHDQVEAMTMGDRVAVLGAGANAGDLMQVDTPQNLYDHPDNLFVAGFIGSPSMNLNQVGVSDADGGVNLHFGEQRVRLGEEVLSKRPRIRDYIGKEVVVGIRPEHFADAKLAEHYDAERSIRAEALLVESLGSEVLVHFASDAKSVIVDKDIADETGDVKLSVAKLDPRTSAREGEAVEMVIDTASLHFFDPGQQFVIAT